jgi:hypothetical protein
LKELILALQEEKRVLAASHDNLDRLYRDSSNSLTILERSHRFSMEELDNLRCRLQESTDDMIRLRQLVSAKDATIKNSVLPRNPSPRS